MGGVCHMYQNVSQVDAVYRIDSIIEQSKVRARSAENEMGSAFNTDSNSKNKFLTGAELEKVAVQATEAIEVVNRQLVFRVHEGTGRPHIRLVESATQEVIREIPPEKMLDVLAGIWEWAGLIVDRKE